MKIWLVLLILPAAACRKVESGGGGSPAPSSGTAAATGSVRSVSAETEGDHRRVRVVAALTNTGSAPMEAAPPAVQLWAGGQAVPPFLAPGLAPPSVAPGKTADVETYWWLSAADAGRPLEFEISGSRTRLNLPP